VAGVDGQGDLFDSGEGERRAEEGMSKAMRALRVQHWKDNANAWFYDLFDTDPTIEFIADDLTAAVGLPDIGPNNNNVVGAWFSAKAKRGEIVFAMRLRKSARIDRHVGLQRVWRFGKPQRPVIPGGSAISPNPTPQSGRDAETTGAGALT